MKQQERSREREFERGENREREDKKKEDITRGGVSLRL